jgi:hypothetical protein
MRPTESAPSPAGGPRCPGCNGLTIEVTIRIGSGTTMEVEKHPAWCSSCLQEKVRLARIGHADLCHCSQVKGPHVHGTPAEAVA